MKKLFLEDLKVGQVFKSGTTSLTAEAIKTFARKFDPQPFHMDEAAAETSFFKGLVASGWHTSSTTMRLMVESIPISGGLIGAGVDELRWHLPVHPNDTLRVESEVLSIRASQSRPIQGFVRFKHTTFNQKDQIVQSSTSVVIVPTQKPVKPAEKAH